MFVKNFEHDVIATIMELIFVSHSKEFMDMKLKFQQRLNALTRYTPFLLLIKDDICQYYVLFISQKVFCWWKSGSPTSRQATGRRRLCHHSN